MRWLLQTLGSSIGSKFVVAITGLLLSGFLVGHLAGNLLVFDPQRQAINRYAEWLHGQGALLWVARLGLLAAFALHVGIAIRLQRQNRAARPTPYAVSATRQASFASRSMLLTGIVVFVYLLLHLLHFTFGAIQPAGRAAFEAGDVHAMVVAGFRNPAFSLLYLVGLAALAIHLSHGLSSLFQTLGLNHPRYQPVIDKIGPVVGIGIAVLYATIPLAVMTGIVT
jgi:succinate dehydrogenase / fumarate reductase cytochrome b subunit